MIAEPEKIDSFWKKYNFWKYLISKQILKYSEEFLQNDLKKKEK